MADNTPPAAHELVPDIPVYFAFVVWCVGLGFGSLVQWRRG